MLTQDSRSTGRYLNWRPRQYTQLRQAVSRRHSCRHSVHVAQVVTGYKYTSGVPAFRPSLRAICSVKQTAAPPLGPTPFLIDGIKKETCPTGDTGTCQVLETNHVHYSYFNHLTRRNVTGELFCCLLNDPVSISCYIAPNDD
jgi:hypothetical protein